MVCIQVVNFFDYVVLIVVVMREECEYRSWSFDFFYQVFCLEDIYVIYVVQVNVVEEIGVERVLVEFIMV